MRRATYKLIVGLVLGLASVAIVYLSTGVAVASITVTKARIGCLDEQRDGNLTAIVAQACNGKDDCSYKAPTEEQYKRAGVRAKTRTFCTQAMEVTYACGDGRGDRVVNVPGDAWKHDPAKLHCDPVQPPPPIDTIHVTRARIGCLDIQASGNLTDMVAKACDRKKTCAFKAPTESQYRAAGVSAQTRSFCTQAMEVTFDCGRNDTQTVNVQGDAWDKPPADLVCNPPQVADPTALPFGSALIKIEHARIGCLDIQTDGNLTGVVAGNCDGRTECTYRAPTPDAYARLGVQARTRPMCTQAMEIAYRCGPHGETKVVQIPGDAWNHDAATLVCNGPTVATNAERVSSFPAEACTAQWPDPAYFVAPREMLDWTPLGADTFPILNHAPAPATPAMYNTTSGRVGAPGSTIGANEGRLAPYLRRVAQLHNAPAALCEAAKAYASDASGGLGNVARPVGVNYGNAMADLAVTGRQAFASFQNLSPTVESIKAVCPAAQESALSRALDRAYAVADAIRVRGHGATPTAARLALGWIAVSGEDDKPYRPVNVPSAPFPQFTVDVDVRGLAGSLQSIRTRYTIAHARPPTFAQGQSLVHAGGRQVGGDLLPNIAPDAHVLVFVHGMDSRLEESLNLTRAMSALAQLQGGRNWTVVSFDMPSSGYSDSIDHHAFGNAGAVTCHNTPMLDFLETYIVKLIDAIDAQTGGKLKPRIRAVVGGSLGGNMALRLGRREALGTQPSAPWLHNVVPWSPASIWPPMTNRAGAMAGCDNGWDLKNDVAVGWPRGMAEKSEAPNDRRNLFYAAFDYAPPSQKPQAQYWWRDGWQCKSAAIISARIDRHETYDPLFRRYRWRLAAEQLAFSHRQNRGTDATRVALADPLFLYNRTRTLLLAGEEDVGGNLGKWANLTAPLMRNTPGVFRLLASTGHSLDDERPGWVAQQIVGFLAADPSAPP